MPESSLAADSVEGSACSSPPVISSSDSSEEETTIRSVSPLTPVSLLDKLHTPKRSDISRKRKVCTNSPQLVRGGVQHALSDPKSVTSCQLVREYPKESLTGLIQLSFRIYHCVHPIHANMFSIHYVTTFQSNCAEGLHFSVFI